MSKTGSNRVLKALVRALCLKHKSISMINIQVPIFLDSASVQSHRLGDAAAESGLADSVHDLHLDLFQHPNDLSKWGTHVWICIPAPGHDLPKSREAIIGYGWSNTLVHHSKSSLHCSHVCKRDAPSDQLPQDDAKTVDVNFLVVRPVLDHLTASEKKPPKIIQSVGGPILILYKTERTKHGYRSLFKKEHITVF